MANPDRPTVELTGPFVPETTTYSVSKRRATTEDDRAAHAGLVERPGILPSRRSVRVERPRAGSVVGDHGWQVERVDDRIWLRDETHEIALDTDQARAIAELLLRAVGR